MVLDPGALHTLATQTCPESIWVLPLSVFGRRLPTHRRGMYTTVQRTGELRGAPQACSTLSNPAGRGQAALAVCTLAVRPSSVALPSDASGRAPACLAPPWRLWWPGLLPQSCTHIRSPMPLCSCSMRPILVLKISYLPKGRRSPAAPSWGSRNDPPAKRGLSCLA